VRDYDACARLGEAIAPGIYHVAICSAFKEPFQRGLGRQQVAILSKYQAQAAWAEPWKSMNGVDPPRGFAFAWFKIGNEDIGVYSLHLKSNLVTHGNREVETAKNIRKGCNFRARGLNLPIFIHYPMSNPLGSYRGPLIRNWHRRLRMRRVAPIN
jgi:hypothetical protein